MVLSRGDDYPIHQTAEPIAYAGTDRNFYDRYFFNGYAPFGDARADRFFAAAFGVYPQLNIADASFSVLRDGVETALHASKWLNMERMDLAVGPIRIEIVEPLRVLRLIVEAPEQGVRAEILFTARAEPIEEPRFTRRIGPRAFMDYTRLTQNGSYIGWIEVDGRRDSIDGFVGTRDRSWGVRPIGARDPQETVPPQVPQFFWLWGPCNFAAGSFFFHTNDDEGGRPWNRRAIWQPDDGRPVEYDAAAVAARVAWTVGTRHAADASVVLQNPSGPPFEVKFEPKQKFFMLGLGYGHPKWGHGMAQGPLAVEREDFRLAEIDRRQPQFLHVQALCDVTYQSPAGWSASGRGVLEQLALGPHAPSGFTGLLDGAGH
jgi:hypothetical protein